MSAPDPDFHVGDVGSAIVLHVRERDLVTDPTGETLKDFDLSGATTKNIKLRRPDGTVTTFTNVPFAGAAQGGAGDGTDGKIMAISVAGTFTIVGDYEAQAELAVTGWGPGHSSSKFFPVGSVIS